MNMALYYVNKNEQLNGDHEVHKEGCQFLLTINNRIHLGDFSNCHDAVVEARNHYQLVIGCYYCSRACHTR